MNKPLLVLLDDLIQACEGCQQVAARKNAWDAIQVQRDLLLSPLISLGGSWSDRVDALRAMRAHDGDEGGAS